MSTPTAEPQYIDCLAEFNTELAKLSTWDLRCLANINKENFISVTEACDPKTDAMVGWEKYTTLNGLVAKKAIPDVTKLTDAQTLNLFDNLLSREFGTLDGKRIMQGPFACVYLHDVEQLCKGNDAVYAFVKSFLASTNMLYSMCGEANVLENEELMFQCSEVLILSQGIDTEAVIALLKESAAKTINADIKLRLELRARQLKALLTLCLAHSTANSDVDAAVTECAQIASDMRSKLIANRRKLGAISSETSFFPNDVCYWLTTNSTTTSTETDLVEQLEKVAEFYVSLAGFTAFAACKNFFEIAVVAEKVATAAPCVLTRPFAYAYIFRDRPSEQPPRVARGDRVLGGVSLRMMVLKYLENDLGAPLYFNLLDASVAPATNPHLLDCAHYLLACANGHSGVKTPANQLMMAQQQIAQSLFRWLEMAGTIVADVIQSALFNMGRHQRRVANRLSEINQLHGYSMEVDARIFCVRMPTSNMPDSELAVEMTSRAAVLTAFATDLSCDAMEKFVRLTMRLDLPTKPEFAACTWYLDLISTTRIEHVQSLIVKPNERGVVIPERKVNKRTGNPLAAPALTSRTSAAVGTVYARADLARQISKMSFMVFALFQSRSIVAGYEDAVSTSLASAEHMFDHRFSFLSRCRAPALPPFSAYQAHVKQLKGASLYRWLTSILSQSTEIAELAKSHATESVATGSVLADEIASLEKSIRALNASISLLRTLLFPNVANEEAGKVIADPTTEELATLLATYEITLEAPYDKSVVVPLLRKKGSPQ